MYTKVSYDGSLSKIKATQPVLRICQMAWSTPEWFDFMQIIQGSNLTIVHYFQATPSSQKNIDLRSN